MFHLCICLIFYLLGDVALMSLKHFKRAEEMSCQCVYQGRTKGEG